MPSYQSLVMPGTMAVRLPAVSCRTKTLQISRTAAKPLPSAHRLQLHRHNRLQPALATGADSLIVRSMAAASCVSVPAPAVSRCSCAFCIAAGY